MALTSRSCSTTSGSAGMLSGMNWTFAPGPVLLTHTSVHTRTGLLGQQVAMVGYFWTCPFPCAACSTSLLQNGLPQAAQGHTGCWLCLPILDKFCTMCQQGVLGDEKHLVF